MQKYTIVSFLVLAELAIFQFLKVFSVKKKEKIKAGYILFFITLLAGVFVSPKGLNTVIADNKGIVLSTPSAPTTQSNNYQDEIILPMESEVLLFNNNNYFRLLNDIGAKLENYKGRKVQISGFVYKEESFKEEEFVVARMLMTCCAADTQTVGLLCKWSEAEALNKEEWISISGVLGVGTYLNKGTGEEIELPAVIVEKVDKIEKIENPYIYQ
jgi:putative membrane protein